MHNVDLKDIDISYILSQILLKKIFSKKIKFITKNIITLITFSMLLSAVLAIFSIIYLHLYDNNILTQYRYSKVMFWLIIVSSIFTIYNAIKLYNKNIYITKSYINDITFSLTKQQCIELPEQAVVSIEIKNLSIQYTHKTVIMVCFLSVR